MATLKNLVNETTNIKNEIKACHTNLKNSLIEKGVECSDNDKIINLIEKISSINLDLKYAKGTSSVGTNSILTIPKVDFTPIFVLSHGYNLGKNMSVHRDWLKITPI